MLQSYFQKMTGGWQGPPRVQLSEIAWGWLGGFLGVGLVAGLNYLVLSSTGLLLLVGSLGASAFLIYGTPKSPLAQPRNLVGGHILSALVGVTAAKLFPGHLWLAAALAVSTSIAVMQFTRTGHPPGGDTALIAVIGDAKIQELGYFYAVMPVAAGVLILLWVALIVNNIPKTRKYPEYWF